MGQYQHYRKCHKCKQQRVFKYINELGDKCTGLVCDESGCIEAALNAGVEGPRI